MDGSPPRSSSCTRLRAPARNSTDTRMPRCSSSSPARRPSSSVTHIVDGGLAAEVPCDRTDRPRRGARGTAARRAVARPVLAVGAQRGVPCARFVDRRGVLDPAAPDLFVTSLFLVVLSMPLATLAGIASEVRRGSDVARRSTTRQLPHSWPGRRRRSRCGPGRPRRAAGGHTHGVGTRPAQASCSSAAG